jgi:NAD(P)-dependent dehydrogenase (short-subunit alcohol dehydrogenase family)
MTSPVIIISGASRGLGAAAARIAGKLRAVVVLSARSVDALETVAEEIHSGGGTAFSVPGDVSQLADCEHIVNQTIAQFGRLDGLVNNAGILSPLSAFVDATPAVPATSKGFARSYSACLKWCCHQSATWLERLLCFQSRIKLIQPSFGA